MKIEQTLQPHSILFIRLENKLHVNGSYCGFVCCKRDIQPKHQLKTHLIQLDLLCWVLRVQTSDCWLYARGVVFLFLTFLARKWIYISSFCEHYTFLCNYGKDRPYKWFQLIRAMFSISYKISNFSRFGRKSREPERFWFKSELWQVCHIIFQP